MTGPGQTGHPEAGTGLLLGLFAYLIWGGFPVYFKALGSVPPLQVVSHRIVWSVVFLSLLLVRQEGRRDLCRALRDRKSMLLLVTTSLLIATNWLVFIIAVGHAQVLQSSLGYFITPFVSVLLGVLFLRERLRGMQLASFILAALGVVLLTVQYGSFPWVALILAATFGSYGLFRKVVQVDSLTGLTVETYLLGPLALAYLLYVGWRGQGAFLHSGLQVDILLMLAGVVTAIPLLLFAAAARRLRLATIGFLQYITPTMHFLLAVLVYGEPFNRAHLASFLFIWGGLCLYSVDAYWAMHAARRGEAG